MNAVSEHECHECQWPIDGVPFAKLSFAGKSASAQPNGRIYAGKNEWTFASRRRQPVKHIALAGLDCDLQLIGVVRARHWNPVSARQPCRI